MTKEPPYEERVWYRNTSTSQRGYLVKSDGKEMIRLDRGPDIEILEPLREGVWRKEDAREEYPVHVASLARVVHEADSALIRALCLHGEHVADWDSMTATDKIDLWEKPPVGAARKRLWAYIKKALGPMVGEDG